MACLTFVLSVASADKALETGDVGIDNLVDGELDSILDTHEQLTNNELERGDSEPLQDDDRDDLSMTSLTDGELDSLLEEESDDRDRVAGRELMVSDRLSWGKVKKKIKRAVKKALRKQERRLKKGFTKSMSRMRRNLKKGMRRTINRVRRDLKNGFHREVQRVKRNIKNRLKQNLEKALQSGLGKLVGSTAMAKAKEVRACYNLAKDIGALLG